MSVGAVNQGASLQFPRNNLPATLDLGTPTEELAVGQLVEVTVTDQSGDGRYSVRLNGQPRSASSTTPLHPGSTVLAVVSSHGNRLELRALTQTEGPAVAQALAALASRYRVELSAAAQREIVMAATAGDAALATLRAGLYLNKVDADITAAALTALVAAQQVPPLSSTVTAGDRGAMVATHPNSATGTGPATLGQLLERVLAQDSLGADVSSGFGDPQGNPQQGNPGQRHPENSDAPQSTRALSQELLNLSDGGALSYRYATLPLLVAGKLVELDMALFQQKPSVSAAGSSRPQRLVMSLNTRGLGTVRIVAQSLHSNLSIVLASTSERGVAALTAALGSMRERLQALGWQVDGVRCELATQVSAAGSAIIDHVLATGSLDRAL